MLPFIKWVGGKIQLLDKIDEHIPKQFSKYYEPFIGSEAVLFHLQPNPDKPEPYRSFISKDWSCSLKRN